MARLSEFEEELLTGFLDGQLSSDELSTVEKLLAENSEAHSRLNELRQLSSAVRVLPAASLGLHFAERVIARARGTAIELGLAGEHHVLLGTVDQESCGAAKRVDRAAPARWEANFRWVGGVTALAASVLFVTYLLRPTGDVAKPAPLLSSTGKQLPKIESDLTERAGDANGETKSPLAQAIAASSPDGGSPVPGPELKPDRSVVPSATVAEKPPVVPSSLFLVVDVALSQDAWQGSAFGKLLLAAGISISAPIVADELLMKSVEEALVIVKATDSETARKPHSRVAMLLVHSDAKSLDKAMMDIYARPADFPELSFNMAYEQSDTGAIFKRLTKVVELVGKTPPNQFWAKPIVVQGDSFDDISSAAQFTGPGKRTMLITNASRQRGWANNTTIGSIEMNPQSEVLFILRQAAAAP